jgi:iron complex transport system ATP-binding protein
VGSILPHSGTCSLNEVVLEELSPRRMAQLVSYIPQRSGISIDISALDVVLMGFNPRLGLLGHPTQAMRDAAQKALEQVGLGSKEQTNYLHLSEGQKQLCILARTLVSECQLLLLDEPESALDFRFRHLMLDLIRSWIREHQTGALITLHDPMLALNYCDQLLLFNEGVLIGELRPQYHSLAKMEELLEKTQKIRFVHDTYWTTKCGMSSALQIRRFGKRLLGIHLRDLALYKKGLKVLSKDAAVGEGVVDFSAVFEAAEKAGCEYYVIEQKTVKPYEKIAISLKNCKKISGTEGE